MENSKLKDKLKQIKAKGVLNFIKDNIRYFAAGAMFIVMVIVLATCTDAVDENSVVLTNSAGVEEYQVDAYKEVNALVEAYYTAYANGDIETLTSLATPVSANEQSYIAMYSKYMDEYQNIKCYTKSGLDSNSYLVSVSMEIKFAGVDTPAPGLDFFYVRTNEDGELYIDNLYCQYNLANQESALDTSIQTLINDFQNQEDVIALQSEIQTKYDTALNGDEDLAAMIRTTIPNAITDWVTQIAAQNVQTPEEGTEDVSAEEEATETLVEETEAPVEQEEETVEFETVYATDKVNVRAEANTSSSKLGSVKKGDAIGRYGIEGEWSKVDFGGTMGYIKTEYLTTQAPDAAEEAEEEETTGASLAEGTVITLDSTVNIRSGMSETSERIGTAYRGEKVTVVMSYAEGWTKVTWNSKNGYIKTSLLQ